MTSYHESLRSACHRGRVLLVTFGLCLGTAQADYNRNDQGVAAKGYDVVAYHTKQAPTKGSSRWQASFDGIAYWFDSKEHRDLFKSSPETYVPAYGGYCSYGIRMGYLSDVDPRAWSIVDGRLYLLFSKGTQHVWEKKLGENIQVADKVWSEMR